MMSRYSEKEALTISITIYIVGGGLLFHYLEKNRNEDGTIPEMSISYTMGVNASVESLLNTILDRILPAPSHRGYSLSIKTKGGEPFILELPSDLEITIRDEKPDKWNIYSSIFFAQVLITTIGYGNLFPVTFAGRMFACGYAVVGVPLLGVWASGIGDLIKQGSKALRKKFDVSKERKKEFLTLQIVILVFFGCTIFIVLPSFIFQFFENWTFDEGIYYSIITLLTIGLGDKVAGHKIEHTGGYLIAIQVWILIGLSWLSMVISMCIALFKTRGKHIVEEAGKHMTRFGLEVKRRMTTSRNQTLKRRQTFSGHRQVHFISRIHTQSAANLTDLGINQTKKYPPRPQRFISVHPYMAERQPLINSSLSFKRQQPNASHDVIFTQGSNTALLDSLIRELQPEMQCHTDRSEAADNLNSSNSHHSFEILDSDGDCDSSTLILIDRPAYTYFNRPINTGSNNGSKYVFDLATGKSDFCIMSKRGIMETISTADINLLRPRSRSS